MRKPTRWAISVAVTIAIGVVPLWWNWLGNRRGFTVETIASSGFGLAANGIDVTYQGRPLGTVKVWTLRLTNTGATPIVPEDIEGALVLTTTDAATHLLRATIEKSTPSDFRPPIANTDRSVSITPRLWNSGDSVTISAVLEGGGSLEPEMRIRGVSRVVTSDLIADAKAGWNIFPRFPLFAVFVFLGLSIGANFRESSSERLALFFLFPTSLLLASVVDTASNVLLLQVISALVFGVLAGAALDLKMQRDIRLAKERARSA